MSLAAFRRPAPSFLDAFTLFATNVEGHRFLLTFKDGAHLVGVPTVRPSETLVAAAVQRRGFAYAEGGDEVVIVLPNTSTPLAAAFAEELRHRIESHRFTIEDASAGITVSIGLSSSTESSTQLTEWANLAKAEAKQRGRNRTVTTGDGKTFHDVGAMRS